MILFPCGKAKMWTVISAEGQTKDHQWIHDTCAEIHDEIQAAMGSDARCNGFIMDNTAANKKAMRMLEETYPWMICLGCCAHSLSLLIKDFVKYLNWLEVLYGLCIMVSNLAGGAEVMKAAFHESMQATYGLVRTICSHVDTRFGSKHLVMRDVMKNHAALQSWVVSATYKAQMDKPKGKAPAHAEEVYDGVTARNPSLMSRCTAAGSLIDPVMDVMHEIEGDKPYLSQMVPIIMHFQRHAQDWSDKYEELSLGAKKDGDDIDVREIINQRLCGFLYRPCMAAAYLVDPANFMQLEAGGYAAPFGKLGDNDATKKYLEDASAVIERLGGKDAVKEFEDFQYFVIGTQLHACVRQITVRPSALYLPGADGMQCASKQS